MSGEEFVWEAPPEKRHGGPGRGRLYDDAIAAVQKNPGRWLRVMPELSKTSGPPYSAKKSLTDRAGDDEAFECVVRRVRDENGGPDKFGVWLRYRTPEQMGKPRRGRPRKT